MEKVEHGFVIVVQYGDIIDSLPPTLKISHIAMIPHNRRKFRVILDLSFQLKVDIVLMPSVNSATTQTVPQHSINQLGRIIQRVVALMAAASTYSPPFLFSKLDIKDSFWWMQVGEEDNWIFSYILPPAEPNGDVSLENVEIVVPWALQIGWIEIQHFFCEVAETARDVAEDLVLTGKEVSVHPLEHLSTPPEMGIRLHFVAHM